MPQVLERPIVEPHKPQVLMIPRDAALRESMTVSTQNAAGSFIAIFLSDDAIVPLRGEDYPILAEIWDNEEDAIYDEL